MVMSATSSGLLLYHSVFHRNKTTYNAALFIVLYTTISAIYNLLEAVVTNQQDKTQDKHGTLMRVASKQPRQQQKRRPNQHTTRRGLPDKQQPQPKAVTTESTTSTYRQAFPRTPTATATAHNNNNNRQHKQQTCLLHADRQVIGKLLGLRLHT